ncbi:MAG: NUDIX hydrolase [Desulfovibrio sp.]|nr:NUDIX hydrolase [Desulfovibrio sp.]
MKKTLTCPHCGKPYKAWRNPSPTVDVIIHDPDRGVVIIKRRNEPHGYALPGGFIDEGEQAEAAAVREMKEETGLDVELTGLLGVYSRPDRDPREHTMSAVYLGRPRNADELRAGDDAGEAAFYQLDALPAPIVFDHVHILADFREFLAGRRCAAPVQPLANA